MLNNIKRWIKISNKNMRVGYSETVCKKKGKDKFNQRKKMNE